MPEYNSPEGIAQWLGCTLDQTTPRLDLRSQDRLMAVAKARIAGGDLRGDLSQWLAKVEFRPRPDVPGMLELAPVPVGEDTIPGRELFEGLYL